MVDAALRELDHLEKLIEELKREYDLFLAGNRRGEPAALRRKVEREVLRVTRYPFTSTAGRFRAKTLAHRFHALDSQVHHLQELRSRKHPEPETDQEPAVLLDQAALDDPGAVEGHLRRIHDAVRQASLAGDGVPSFEVLKRRLLSEARKHVGLGGVRGIRFKVVTGEGGAKVLGEVLPTDTGHRGV